MKTLLILRIFLASFIFITLVNVYAIKNNKGIIATVEDYEITFENICKTNIVPFVIKDYENDDEVIEILRKKIEITIRDMFYEKYLPELTEDQIESEFKKAYPLEKEVYVESMEKNKNKTRTLLKAMEMIHVQKLNKDSVYNLVYRRNGIEQNFWDALVENYSSPESRENLKKSLQITIDDILEPDKGFILLLKGKMMDEIIDREMKSISPDYKEFYDMKTKDAGDSITIIESAMKDYFLRFKRDLWWRNKSKEMNIVINVDKYKKVIDLLFPDK